MNGVMNEEMLAEQIERRAREWDVAAPPYQAILGEGRRQRARRRGAAAAVAASTLVVAAVAGFALTGTERSTELAPAPAPSSPAAPVAEGQWVGINGVGFDVPADWDADLVACDPGQRFESWTLRAGSGVGDTCAPFTGTEAMTVTFVSAGEEELRAVTGPTSDEGRQDRTVDGSAYTVSTPSCGHGPADDPSCLGGAYFPDQQVAVTVIGAPDADTISAFLDTVRLVPGLAAPGR